MVKREPRPRLLLSPSVDQPLPSTCHLQTLKPKSRNFLSDADKDKMKSLQKHGKTAGTAYKVSFETHELAAAALKARTR